MKLVTRRSRSLSSCLLLVPRAAQMLRIGQWCSSSRALAQALGTVPLRRTSMCLRVKRLCSRGRLTFDMRGAARLAGQRPLDGRVRRRHRWRMPTPLLPKLPWIEKHRKLDCLCCELAQARDLLTPLHTCPTQWQEATNRKEVEPARQRAFRRRQHRWVHDAFVLPFN